MNSADLLAILVYGWSCSCYGIALLILAGSWTAPSLFLYILNPIPSSESPLAVNKLLHAHEPLLLPPYHGRCPSSDACLFCGFPTAASVDVVALSRERHQIVDLKFHVDEVYKITGSKAEPCLLLSFPEEPAIFNLLLAIVLS